MHTSKLLVPHTLTQYLLKIQTMGPHDQHIYLTIDGNIASLSHWNNNSHKWDDEASNLGVINPLWALDYNHPPKFALVFVRFYMKWLEMWLTDVLIFCLLKRRRAAGLTNLIDKCRAAYYSPNSNKFYSRRFSIQDHYPIFQIGRKPSQLINNTINCVEN